MIAGIDCSHWQGQVDWAKVAAAGIRFAWIKASQGTNRIDPQFKAYREGAAANGIRWGAYHFAAAGDPLAEAAWFARQGILGGGLPPALDLEVAGMDAGWAVRFLDELERICGLAPDSAVFYGNASYVGSSVRLARHPLWFPRYRTAAVDPDPAKIGGPFDSKIAGVGAWGTRVAVWQYTSTGRVDGIAGNVDRNVVLDDTWWAALTGAPAPTPEPTKETDDVYNVFNDGTRQFVQWGVFKLPIVDATDLPKWQYIATASGGSDIGENQWLASQLRTVSNFAEVAPGLDTDRVIDAVKALPAEVIAALKAAL